MPGKRDLAEELADETITTMVKNRYCESLDPAKSVSAYIWRIMKSLYVDMSRKEKVSGKYRRSKKIESSVSEEHSDDSALRKAVGELPEHLRAVIYDRYGRGITIEEIGRLEGKVKSEISHRHQKALGILRENLEAA